MKDWQIIPEIVGCNASLRMAAMQAVDAVEQGRHLVVEGEPGSGRRLLARSAWNRRSPGTSSLFTLDCRVFNSDGVETLLFGERSTAGSNTTIRMGKLNMAAGGGLLLLHAEYLPLKTQGRLAQTLGQYLLYPRGETIQLMMTCAPSLHAPLSLHPELAALLVRVRVPALRERVEDIRAIAEAFLRNASPLHAIHCSQALIDKFCAYNWPGNINELRSVLRRLLLEAHHGLLDVSHLADLMCRDESCFSLLQGDYRVPNVETGLNLLAASPETRSMQ
jgi:Nif-specific regulatory protein